MKQLLAAGDLFSGDPWRVKSVLRGIQNYGYGEVVELACVGDDDVLGAVRDELETGDYPAIEAEAWNGRWDDVEMAWFQLGGTDTYTASLVEVARRRGVDGIVHQPARARGLVTNRR